ncbi:hypothetical protein HYH03_018210 [Edaphochlamys debaryana]|uniref:Uncharacterized protein n=1 Tax=Edaphochlamys debaryana TaxID=47281 RepID=A0A835XGE4_9CHLO|nr:hypothetical protein HYH03_018210 [Edaphochlamys debaryana]|eukprot:KAG2482865.1 hypothetical protein HYH03_018210 [Edaphochlamys debaryana]
MTAHGEGEGEGDMEAEDGRGATSIAESCNRQASGVGSRVGSSGGGGGGGGVYGVEALAAPLSTLYPLPPTPAPVQQRQLEGRAPSVTVHPAFDSRFAPADCGASASVSAPGLAAPLTVGLPDHDPLDSCRGGSSSSRAGSGFGTGGSGGGLGGLESFGFGSPVWPARPGQPDTPASSPWARERVPHGPSPGPRGPPGPAMGPGGGLPGYGSLPPREAHPTESVEAMQVCPAAQPLAATSSAPLDPPPLPPLATPSSSMRLTARRSGAVASPRWALSRAEVESWSPRPHPPPPTPLRHAAGAHPPAAALLAGAAQAAAEGSGSWEAGSRSEPGCAGAWELGPSGPEGWPSSLSGAGWEAAAAAEGERTAGSSLGGSLDGHYLLGGGGSCGGGVSEGGGSGLGGGGGISGWDEGGGQGAGPGGLRPSTWGTSGQGHPAAGASWPLSRWHAALEGRTYSAGTSPRGPAPRVPWPWAPPHLNPHGPASPAGASGGSSPRAAPPCVAAPPPSPSEPGSLAAAHSLPAAWAEGWGWERRGRGVGARARGGSVGSGPPPCSRLRPAYSAQPPYPQQHPKPLPGPIVCLLPPSASVTPGNSPRFGTRPPGPQPPLPLPGAPPGTCSSPRFSALRPPPGPPQASPLGTGRLPGPGPGPGPGPVRPGSFSLGSGPFLGPDPYSDPMRTSPSPPPLGAQRPPQPPQEAGGHLEAAYPHLMLPLQPPPALERGLPPPPPPRLQPGELDEWEPLLQARPHCAAALPSPTQLRAAARGMLAAPAAAGGPAWGAADGPPAELELGPGTEPAEAEAVGEQGPLAGAAGLDAAGGLPAFGSWALAAPPQHAESCPAALALPCPTEAEAELGADLGAELELGAEVEAMDLGDLGDVGDVAGRASGADGGGGGAQGGGGGWQLDSPPLLEEAGSGAGLGLGGGDLAGGDLARPSGSRLEPGGQGPDAGPREMLSGGPLRRLRLTSKPPQPPQPTSSGPLPDPAPLPSETIPSESAGPLPDPSGFFTSAPPPPQTRPRPRTDPSLPSLPHPDLPLPYTDLPLPYPGPLPELSEGAALAAAHASFLGDDGDDCANALQRAMARERACWVLSTVWERDDLRRMAESGGAGDVLTRIQRRRWEREQQARRGPGPGPQRQAERGQGGVEGQGQPMGTGAKEGVLGAPPIATEGQPR